MEVFTRLDGMILTFITDNALAVQRKDDRLTGSCVLGEAGSLIKRHDHKLHFIVMYHVHIDDLALHIGNELRQFEDFSCLDCFAHGIIPPYRDFSIDSAF